MSLLYSTLQTQRQQDVVFLSAVVLVFTTLVVMILRIFYSKTKTFWLVTELLESIQRYMICLHHYKKFKDNVCLGTIFVSDAKSFLFFYSKEIATDIGLHCKPWLRTVFIVVKQKSFFFLLSALVLTSFYVICNYYNGIWNTILSQWVANWLFFS